NSNEAYSPFAILALLEHGGDFSAAARTLGKNGYGEKCGRATSISTENQAEPSKCSDDDAKLQELASVPILEYERLRRDVAKQLKCRATTLDQLVAQYRPQAQDGLQGHALSLKEPEPWTTAIDGAVVLSEVTELLADYVALPPGAADIVAAWIAHA